MPVVVVVDDDLPVRRHYIKFQLLHFHPLLGRVRERAPWVRRGESERALIRVIAVQIGAERVVQLR